MRCSFRVCCLLLATAVAATGAVYVVSPDGTGDFPTIQAAINGAADGDIVELTDGTFIGAGNRDIDFLGKAHGLPGAISGHNSYYLWGPGDVHSGEVLIVLGSTPEELSEWFEEVERVDTVRCTYCVPYQNNVPVHVCRKLKAPVEQAWSQLKHFD